MNSPAQEATRCVDVTDAFDQKVTALLAHASQIGDRAGLPERLRRRMADNAVSGGLPAGKLAEFFQVIAIK